MAIMNTNQSGEGHAAHGAEELTANLHLYVAMTSFAGVVMR